MTKEQVEIIDELAQIIKDITCVIPTRGDGYLAEKLLVSFNRADKVQDRLRIQHMGAS